MRARRADETLLDEHLVDSWCVRIGGCFIREDV
jgi:hypothetical protein